MEFNQIIWTFAEITDLMALLPKKWIFFLVAFGLAGNVKSQYLDSLLYLRSFTKAELDSTVDDAGIPSAFVGNTYDIDVYKVVYRSVSYDSTAVSASGLLAFPRNANCKFPLLSYSHGTKVEREKVPSRLSGTESLIGLIIASNGYVTTLPDYIGLGNSPLSILHLSNHASTLASSGIDLLRAVKEASPQAGFRLNGQLFITGYSEGGYAAMCIHRKIEKSLNAEFTVTASAPMSGAYDLSGTMYNLVLSYASHPNPLFLPYLIFSWNQKYHFYTQPGQYFTAPYDTVLPPLFDGFHDDNAINLACADTPRLMLQQTLIDSMQSDSNHIFRMALKENDAYTGWVPQAPVKLFFCKGDNTVPWQNAEVAYNNLVAAGCSVCDTVNVSSSADHVACAQFAVLYTKSFFEGLRIIDSCQASSINSVSKSRINCYPNPAIDMVNLRMPADLSSIEYTIYNTQGIKVIERNINVKSDEYKIDISSLSGGVYFLSLHTTKGVFYARFLKQ